MKEFFKPTIPKIVLMLLLPLYLAVELEVVQAGESAFNLIASPFPFVVLIFAVLAYWGSAPSGTFGAEWSMGTAGQKILGIALEVLLPLAISYLFACLILYSVKKLKPQKDNNKTKDSDEK